MRLPTWVLAGLLGGTLAGCATPATGSFQPADANRVTNGMTREQVVAVMGGPPAWARQDGQTLTWERSDGAFSGDTSAISSVTFHFDPAGRAFGIPAGGVLGAAGGGSGSEAGATPAPTTPPPGRPTPPAA